MNLFAGVGMRTERGPLVLRSTAHQQRQLCFGNQEFHIRKLTFTFPLNPFWKQNKTLGDVYKGAGTGEALPLQRFTLHLWKYGPGLIARKRKANVAHPVWDYLMITVSCLITIHQIPGGVNMHIFLLSRLKPFHNSCPLFFVSWIGNIFFPPLNRRQWLEVLVRYDSGNVRSQWARLYACFSGKHQSAK